jgi:hypothetical protein
MLKIGRAGYRKWGGGQPSDRDEAADYAMAQPLLPEFDRNSGINIVRFDRKTRRLTYVANNNLWPMSHMFKPYETGLQGKVGEGVDFGPAGRAASATGAAVEAFGGLEIWAGIAWDMYKAFSDAGYDEPTIWEEMGKRFGGDAGQATVSAIGAGLKGVNPPGFKQLYDTGRSAAYAADPWKLEEDERKPQPLLLDLVKYSGVTLRTVDIADEARFKLGSVGRSYGNAHSAYNKKVDETTPAAEKLKAKENLSRELKFIEKDFNTLIRSLRHYGMKDAEIKAILANTKAPGRNLSQTVADELLAYGRLIPRSSVK